MMNRNYNLTNNERTSYAATIPADETYLNEEKENYFTSQEQEKSEKEKDKDDYDDDEIENSKIETDINSET